MDSAEVEPHHQHVWQDLTGMFTVIPMRRIFMESRSALEIVFVCTDNIATNSVQLQQKPWVTKGHRVSL